MRVLTKAGFSLAAAMLLTIALTLTVASVQDATAGQKMNPCGMNPCSTKSSNPCGIINPCGAKMSNPCGMSNPCSAKMKNKPIRNYPLKDYGKVVDRGERLWVDSTLGKSGLSCSTCHPKGKTSNLNSKPYPKYIKMADDVLTLDQMINFCMVNPMKGKPLGWNSQKMTSLAAYVSNNSTGVANPCGTKNPCAINNPCSTNNPCAVKNPCSTKNPCGNR